MSSAKFSSIQLTAVVVRRGRTSARGTVEQHTSGNVGKDTLEQVRTAVWNHNALQNLHFGVDEATDVIKGHLDLLRTNDRLGHLLHEGCVRAGRGAATGTALAPQCL